ncbi:unnamed protein product, partial [Dibothriocephalus latus]
RDASNAWYSEIKDFKFGVQSIQQCGHFTQLVWKATKLVGFGMAYSSDKHTVCMVAQYYPQGNWGNKVLENVPAPLPAAKTADQDLNLDKTPQSGEKRRPEALRSRFKTVELQSLMDET